MTTKPTPPFGCLPAGDLLFASVQTIYVPMRFYQSSLRQALALKLQSLSDPLTFFRPTRALLLLATLAAAAQTATPPATSPAPKAKAKSKKSEAPAYNTNLIVLDAAHGGTDNGATLGENSLEKDATVALAALLKPRLEAKGFTVVLTHNASSDEVASDTRVELANRSRAVACLLLHASNGGHGVHLYTSALTPNHPSLTPDEPKEIQPWDSAQASVLPQSMRLSGDLAAAINGIRVPLVVSQASVKPIDSLTCPVVALELSPLPGDTPTPASDPAYQARVADAVAQALVFWRGHVISISSAAAAAQANSTPTPATADPAKPAPKPKPKPVPPPVKIPDEEPLVDSPPPPKTRPAPIVRPAPDVPATVPPTGAKR